MDVYDRLLKVAHTNPECQDDPPELTALRKKCDNYPECSGERAMAYGLYLDTARFYHEARWARLKEIKKPPAESEKDRTEAEPRWYFGTFTQPDTNTDPHEILKNTKKVIDSKMVSPIEWCYSLELTKKGAPHTHYAFLTKKYPEYKKIHAFNCSKLRILQRSETNPARNAEHAIRYVQKHQTKPSEEWLVENELKQTIWLSDNCPQFEQLECPMSPGGPNKM